MNDLAYINKLELLELADSYVASRPSLFHREAVFTAPVQSGGVFHQGLQVRVVLRPDGCRAIYAAHSGVLLAESLPGAPLVPGPARRPRTRIVPRR